MQYEIYFYSEVSIKMNYIVLYPVVHKIVHKKDSPNSRILLDSFLSPHPIYPFHQQLLLICISRICPNHFHIIFSATVTFIVQTTMVTVIDNN